MQKTAIFRSVSGALVLVNTAIFIAMWVQSGYANLTVWIQSGYANFDNTLLLDWGANYAPLTLEGEPWRLLTSAFLHSGWLHLLVNMYMLILLGSVLESIVGRWRFASIYLLSAMGGSLLSALWQSSHEVGVIFKIINPVVSVGASGALMGLAGAALFLSLRPHPQTDVQIKFNPIAQVILINLAFGFAQQGIDNAAHIGGLITGFAVAAALHMKSVVGTTPLRLAGFSTFFTVTGTVMFIWLALHGGNGTLASIKADEVQREDAESRKRHDKFDREKARPAALREQAEIDRMIQEDARTQPAPVNNQEEAEGEAVNLTGNLTDFVIGASEHYAYVTDSTNNALHVIDLSRKIISKTIRGEHPNEESAYGLTVDQKEHTAYVAAMKKDSVTRINLDKGKIIDSVKVGRYPDKLLLSPDGDVLYVFNDMDDTVTVLSVPQWPKVLATLKVGDGGKPKYGSMWLSSDGKRLFAKSAREYVASEFDTGDFHWVGDHYVGYYGVVPIFSRSGIWLRSLDGYDGREEDRRDQSLKWADSSTLKSRKIYDTCNNGSLIGTNNDGSWIVASYDDELQIVKVATRRPIRAYPFSALDVLYSLNRSYHYSYIPPFDGVTAIFSKDEKTLYVLTKIRNIDDGTPFLLILNVDKFLAPNMKLGDFLCPVSIPE